MPVMFLAPGDQAWRLRAATENEWRLTKYPSSLTAYQVLRALKAEFPEDLVAVMAQVG